jgi:hypothetical protein
MTERNDYIENFDGCQLPSVPHFSEGPAKFGPQPFILRFKRTFARPWNYHVKKWLKKIVKYMEKRKKKNGSAVVNPALNFPVGQLKTGDWVQVRSKEEIESTLDRFKELRGCAFLADMWQYVGTTHRVLKVMERFLDERDYKVKKVRNIILLDGVICTGTPAFGPCDRSCFLFWREEWLKKVEGPAQ